MSSSKRERILVADAKFSVVSILLYPLSVLFMATGVILELSLFNAFKYSEDKNKLVSFIRDNSRMEIDLSAARVIEAITHMKMEIEEGDRNMGSVNMCRALEEIMQDSKNEGIALGRSEGVDIGLIRGKMQVLSTLIQNGDISLQKAAAIMDMTPEEFIAKSKSIS